MTMGDAAIDPAQEFPKALEKLLKEVFCGGQAGAADKAEPAQWTGTSPATRTP
ncbi:hypothetical protein [Streptomyces sp. NPDC048650]|uniref:hypothetical protein n=1 Tax=unclassified Streptomyces TaxID=2593676 RepID=UPI00371984CF